MTTYDAAVRGSSPPKSSPLGGPRLDLDRADAVDPRTSTYAWTDEVGLDFTLEFADDRRARINITRVEPPQLARELAMVLWNGHWRGAGLDTAAVSEHAAITARSFCEFLANRDPAARIRSLSGVGPDDLALYGAWLGARKSDNRARTLTDNLLRLLKVASRWVSVRRDVTSYRYPTDLWPEAGTTPRPAYSPYVAGQIYAAARADFEEGVRRLDVIGPEVLARGQDPRRVPGGWDRLENVVWFLANVRFGRRPELERLAGYAFAPSVTEATELLLPTTRDLVAFAAIMGLETGVPSGSLAELNPDCLVNATGRFADLLYRKDRSGKKGLSPETVRDGQPYDPGWMVRTMLRMTTRARAIAGPAGERHLLLAFNRRGGKGTFVSNTVSVQQARVDICVRHEILDDDGNRLTKLTLCRLRKTAFSDRYRAVKGNLNAVAAASSHSPMVSATHYASDPGLVEEHRTTIHDALDMALGAAMAAAEERRKKDIGEFETQPKVLDNAEVAALRADPERAAAVLGVPEHDVRPLLDGELDVWLAGCRDISDSPFGSPDGLCRVPLWGCLNCRNAVITSAKLPAILTFLEEILLARQRMDLSAWARRFGAAYLTIMKGILPRVGPERLRAARDALGTEAGMPLLSLIPFQQP